MRNIGNTFIKVNEVRLNVSDNDVFKSLLNKSAKQKGLERESARMCFCIPFSFSSIA